MSTFKPRSAVVPAVEKLLAEVVQRFSDLQVDGELSVNVYLCRYAPLARTFAFAVNAGMQFL